ncbi:MBL fold metallo-hydrolase [Gemmata sp. G18]|uniref:MBL fold metallo-hydrolase n=1 Tax=Gemmata palustris TaxID=2822762 RepID=A0ABS5BRT4_9BACT|nr:MBL fold metallo-hydrolase [Gemmata palustris]MBP3956366.1 MBL fold metallo-hydrolase [Gemmata palustris]
MEVYFLDVGQGTCNVILLGNRRAIVIDTGRRAAELQRLLHHLSVDTLACLVLSHLDADHVGGAPAILTAFRNRIETICYPNDHRTVTTPVWHAIHSEIRGGYLTEQQLVRLECEGAPKTVWSSRGRVSAELKLFSPTFGQNQLAIRARDSNVASGVLVLKVGNHRVVFPGDSSLDQWHAIRDLRGSALPCDAIAVPHHAGTMWPSHWDDATIRGELQWLYTHAVCPKHAIVSVGTSNDEGHPRKEVIEELRGSGAIVICTQITKQCCKSTEKRRPALIPLILPGRSAVVKSRTTAGNSKDVGCAGTVVADITPTGFTIRRLTQHQNAVQVLATQPRCSPLCVPV